MISKNGVISAKNYITWQLAVSVSAVGATPVAVTKHFGWLPADVHALFLAAPHLHWPSVVSQTLTDPSVTRFGRHEPASHLKCKKKLMVCTLFQLDKKLWIMDLCVAVVADCSKAGWKIVLDAMRWQQFFVLRSPCQTILTLESKSEVQILD